MSPDTPLRVLIVCAGDLDWPGEKHALAVAQQLARLGHSAMLSLGALTSAKAPDEQPRLQLHAHRFRGRALRREDREAAVRFAPDLIHAQTSRLPVIAATRSYLGAAPAPVFVRFEDSEWHLMQLPYGGTRQPWPVRRALSLARPDAWLRSTRSTLRWTGAHARALDALTPALADEVRRRLGRECTALLPPSPRLLPDPEPFDFPPGLAGRELVVLAGSLGEETLIDFRLALGATALLQREGRKVALVHAGKVHLSTPLHEIVAEFGLEHASVEALGYLPGAQHHHLLRQAAVLVQPGSVSPVNRLRLPSKLQSYFEAGTPTVTYGAGFGEMLRDRDEVLKTTTSDPAELAGRIAEVLDDPDLRRTLAAGGPRAASRLFDPERTVRKLVDHYHAHLR